MLSVVSFAFRLKRLGLHFVRNSDHIISSREIPERVTFVTYVCGDSLLITDRGGTVISGIFAVGRAKFGVFHFSGYPET